MSNRLIMPTTTYTDLKLWPAIFHTFGTSLIMCPHWPPNNDNKQTCWYIWRWSPTSQKKNMRWLGSQKNVWTMRLVASTTMSHLVESSKACLKLPIHDVSSTPSKTVDLPPQKNSCWILALPCHCYHSTQSSDSSVVSWQQVKLISMAFCAVSSSQSPRNGMYEAQKAQIKLLHVAQCKFHGNGRVAADLPARAPSLFGWNPLQSVEDTSMTLSHFVNHNLMWLFPKKKATPKPSISDYFTGRSGRRETNIFSDTW